MLRTDSVADREGAPFVKGKMRVEIPSRNGSLVFWSLVLFLLVKTTLLRPHSHSHISLLVARLQFGLTSKCLSAHVIPLYRKYKDDLRGFTSRKTTTSILCSSALGDKITVFEPKMTH